MTLYSIKHHKNMLMGTNISTTLYLTGVDVKLSTQSITVHQWPGHPIHCSALRETQCYCHIHLHSTVSNNGTKNRVQHPTCPYSTPTMNSAHPFHHHHTKTNVHSYSALLCRSHNNCPMHLWMFVDPRPQQIQCSSQWNPPRGPALVYWTLPPRYKECSSRKSTSVEISMCSATSPWEQNVAVIFFGVQVLMISKVLAWPDYFIMTVTLHGDMTEICSRIDLKSWMRRLKRVEKLPEEGSTAIP